MNLHCFGAATPCGEALRRLAEPNFVGYSRNPSASSGLFYVADLTKPSQFRPAVPSKEPVIWISFAPIWLLAPFFESIATYHPDCLKGLRGLIACSSSSAITKRFATNRFDRQLVDRLLTAEDHLLSTCSTMSIAACILRPTMIYGQVGVYGNNNLNRLVKQLRRFPLLPLPAETGLRQPIHATQLASVALYLAHQLSATGLNASLPERIALGGDSTLSYNEMIIALQKAQLTSDPARQCRLLSIPNRLFFLLSAPLFLFSPKAFEAVLRMGANLSGFTPVHQILGSEPQPFPLSPHV